MSRIDDLIAELCPDGVEFRPLRDVGDWYGGGTPSKHRSEFWKSGTIPWLSPKDMGRPIVETTEDYITEAAVTGSATKLVPANSVALVVRSSILDRFLPAALIPIPITLNQDMKAVVTYEGVLPVYLAHLLRSLGPEVLRAVRKTGASVASLEVPKLLSYRVPVPPVAIQQELVRILDKRMALQAELETELEAEFECRSCQYTYYRDSLLTFAGREKVRWALMGEVGEFIRGRRFTKHDVVPEGIGSIHYGEIYTHYGVFASGALSHVRPKLRPTLRFARTGDVVIAAVGETVEDVCKAVAWLGDEDVAIHDDCFAYRHTLNPKFVSYYFQTSAFHSEKNKYVARAKVKRISGESLAKLAIPVPTMEEQERIVVTLDRFDALVSGLSIGLSAEIKARRQQYEYYRDKLLSFEEAA